MSSSGDVHLLSLAARDHGADRRLVAVAGVTPEQATVRGVENVMLEAFAQIRERQAFVPLADRSPRSGERSGAR